MNIVAPLPPFHNGRKGARAGVEEQSDQHVVPAKQESDEVQERTVGTISHCSVTRKTN